MRKCFCEWCERTEENWNGRFKRIDKEWYCDKHYVQLKKYGKLKDTQGIIHNKGINDMPRGWTKENKENTRIYYLWHSMMTRCYSEVYQNKFPTYKGCYVCDKWLKLSGFIDDLPKIDGYELWLNNDKRIELDKDIKSNGINKCYCLKQCMFVTSKENTIQAIKTRNNDYSKNRIGEKHHNHKPVVQYDENMILIKVFHGGLIEASNETGIDVSSISRCCKNKQKRTRTKDGKFYIWKYYKEDDVND